MHYRYLVLGIVAGCHVYRGGFEGHQGPFLGRHIQFECLDLAVAAVPARDASGPVVRYTLGNRCEHKIDVDLASVRVVARDPGGVAHPLAPYDPRNELKPLPFGPLWVTKEQIEYKGIDATQVASLCFDLRRVATGPVETNDWLCVAGVTS